VVFANHRKLMSKFYPEKRVKSMYRALVLVSLIVLPAAHLPAFDFDFGSRTYGLRSSTFVPSPPYFSVFPPVYYGQRYSRPYGISPFPADGYVAVPPSYKGVPGARTIKPIMNPYCADCTASIQDHSTKLVGRVEVNPYAEGTIKLATGKSL
jgi:hypothetical protein